MSVRQKSLAKRLQRNVELPKGIDWSRRAIPKDVIAAEGYSATDMLGLNSALQRLHTISQQNATFMRHMLINNSGVVSGFHGTTTANAARIMHEGFENRTNDEGRTGVSAWAGIVGHQAIHFARERSREAGASDEGAIVHVKMTSPVEDTAHGRLEWFSDADSTEVVGVYSVPEFYDFLRRTGNTALSGTVNASILPQQSAAPKGESLQAPSRAPSSAQ